MYPPNWQMLFLLFLVYSASATSHCHGWTETCNQVLDAFAGVFRYNPPVGEGTSGDGLTGDSYVIYAGNGYRFESTFLTYSGTTSQIQFSQVSQYQANCSGYTSNVLTTALTLSSPAAPVTGIPVNGPSSTVPIICNNGHLTITNPPDTVGAGVVSLDVYISHTIYTLNFGNATNPILASHRWAKVNNQG